MDTQVLKQQIAQLIKEDKYPEAFVNCGKFLRNHPGDEEIIQITQFLFQRIQDAHIEITPTTSEEFLLRGIALFYAGDLKGSVEDYTQAIGLDPQYDYAYKCRHFSYAAMGKINESLKDIRRAISLVPDEGAYYFDLANLLSYLPDKKEECLLCYVRAVELRPESEFFWNNFGIELQNQGYIQDAIEKYNKAIELNPNFDDAIWNRDNCVQHLNNNT